MFLLYFLFLTTSVYGHGRLSVPTSRDAGNPTWQQNAPVAGNTADAFVCRNGPSGTTIPVQAGAVMDFSWTFDAAHVGDCAIYVSYDIDDQGSLGDSQFFKIANLFKCRLQTGQTVPVTMPDWLPAGPAVIRWDWYALHQYPGVELYSQCIDVQISSSSSNQPSDIPSYSITNPPIYPSSGTDGVGYRDPHNNVPQYMTGPPCAFDDMTINDCALTAKGTTGSIDVTTLATGGAGGGGTISGGGGSTGGSTPAPVTGGTSGGTTSACTGVEVYVVEAGDTLSAIADAYVALGWDVTIKSICDENELPDCNLIFVGQDLIIPATGCPEVDNTHLGTGGGETSSASSFGVGMPMFLLALWHSF